MIYEDDLIYIEQEKSEIPWVKIFTKRGEKELSDCDEITRMRLFEALIATEMVMREFYNPDKINFASFANYVPRVHIHVQARFKNDSFFPQCMWGKKQREAKLNLKSFDEFSKILNKTLRIKFEQR